MEHEPGHQQPKIGTGGSFQQWADIFKSIPIDWGARGGITPSEQADAKRLGLDVDTNMIQYPQTLPTSPNRVFKSSPFIGGGSGVTSSSAPGGKRIDFKPPPSSGGPYRSDFISNGGSVEDSDEAYLDRVIDEISTDFIDETDLEAIAGRISRYTSLIQTFAGYPQSGELSREVGRLSQKALRIQASNTKEEALKKQIETRAYNAELLTDERQYLNNQSADERQYLNNQSIVNALLPFLLRQQFDFPREDKRDADRLALQQEQIDLENRIATSRESRAVGADTRDIAKEKADEEKSSRAQQQMAGLVKSLFPNLDIGNELLTGGIPSNILESIIAIARNKNTNQSSVARPTISWNA